MPPSKASSAVPPSKPSGRRVSNFKQQKLAACQPVYDVKTTYPVLLVIGVVYLPLGISLLISSNNVREFTYDYTYCVNIDTGTSTCADFVVNASNAGIPCYCKLKTLFLEHFSKPVFVYYGLSNYFQNYRNYIRSRDDKQLHADITSPEKLKADCEPLRTVVINGTTYGYAPCGCIANSLFNDSFVITFNDFITVGLNGTGIAWTTDTDTRFRSPSSWSGFTKPLYWKKSVWELDLIHSENNGYVNEDLIVWMRTSFLPTFRKLYRRVNHDTTPFLYGLPAGAYTIDIEYNYPVAEFGGRKRIIISTASIIGGKNPFLGITYLVMGCVNIVIGLAFFTVIMIKDQNGPPVEVVRVKRNQQRVFSKPKKKAVVNKIPPKKIKKTTVEIPLPQLRT